MSYSPQKTISTSKSPKRKRVGVVGLGTVGSGVVEVITNDKFPELELARIVEKYPEKKHLPDIPAHLITTEISQILDDPSIDIVVEVIGGVEPAASIILEALRRGKDVVTSNKVVIAERGQEIFTEALDRGCYVGFRGTFVGCHSLLHDLSARLKQGRIKRLAAILNGTCNYILSNMRAQGKEFRDILGDAQRLGYAERDPSQDIDGLDTAYKLRILLGLTNNTRNIPQSIPVQGIGKITLQDIQYAAELGYRIKLLGVIEHHNEGAVHAQVFPALVKADSMLGTIEGANNAIEVEDNLGVLSGLIAPGAGKYPTAVAILKDLTDIVSGIPAFIPEGEQEILLGDTSELLAKFYLRLEVMDQTGVLAQIASIFGKYNISIAAVIQKESLSANCVPIVMTTHMAKGKDIREALNEIDNLPVVQGKTQLIQIYDARM